MNKLIIGDTEFELEHHLTMSSSQSHYTPYVTIGNTMSVGKAIPSTPKEKPNGYEITSFDTNTFRGILNKNSNGKFGIVDWDLHFCLEKFDIHSVKRISDNTEFIIGEKVERMDDNDTIDAFILNYKGNDIWVSTDVKNGYGSSLECAKKVRQPILTTEDEVDVYEGARVWFVTPSRNYEIEQFDFIKSDPFDELKAYHDIHKYFSTKEAADNYVLLNQPCLSMEDIFKICDKYNVMNYLYVQGKVREIVKDKLAKNKINVK